MVARCAEMRYEGGVEVRDEDLLVGSYVAFVAAACGNHAAAKGMAGASQNPVYVQPSECR